MKTEELNLFWYWIKERHQIFLKKEAGKPRPWTKDSTLDTYKFTNPFRQNDRVTRELGKRIKKGDSAAIIFKKIIIFRMFNWPETYDELNSYGLIENWNWEVAMMELDYYKHLGNKIFTGAYVITNNGKKDSKISLVCNAIDNILHWRNDLVDDIKNCNSLQESTKILTEFDMVGPFIAYELVTDLRHTKILSKATDIYTWANPGPGAKRGTHRILFGTKRGELPKQTKIDYQVFMQGLMKTTQVKLGKLKMFSGVKFEMRDIEHSLCEFDKYMRVINGEGKPRSKYK